MTDPLLKAYAELQQAFEHYNVDLFDGQIPRGLITMQREKRTDGDYFRPSALYIEMITPQLMKLLSIQPISVLSHYLTLQTLVHEMAHAWQQHFGNPGRRGYHNEEWADKMESIGLMPSSTGKLGGFRTGEKMADYAIKGGLFMQATDKLLAAWLPMCSSVDRFFSRCKHRLSQYYLDYYGCTFRVCDSS